MKQAIVQGEPLEYGWGGVFFLLVCFVLTLKQASEVIRFGFRKLFLLSAEEGHELYETGNREASWVMVTIQAKYHEALPKAKVVELEKMGQIQTSPQR